MQNGQIRLAKTLMTLYNKAKFFSQNHSSWLVRRPPPHSVSGLELGAGMVVQAGRTSFSLTADQGSRDAESSSHRTDIQGSRCDP